MKNIQAFIFGILAALGAVITELLLSNLYFIFSGKNILSTYFHQITFFLICVILIEESFKYLMLFELSAFLKTSLRIATVFFAGLGFSIFEIFFIFFSRDINHSFWEIAGIFMLHILTASLMGWFIVLKTKIDIFSSLKIIALAAFLHLLYNLMIIYNLDLTAIAK